ncbi:MAG: FAD-binding oxidoreductase, partial [Cypionkella sp.]|nr:FAD-binding oxidoreductase [Cypionkella sp.]
MTLLTDLTAALGAAHVIIGTDLERYRSDWTTHYTSNPIAAVRPGSTAEVVQVMHIAAQH